MSSRVAIFVYCSRMFLAGNQYTKYSRTSSPSEGVPGRAAYRW